MCDHYMSASRSTSASSAPWKSICRKRAAPLVVGQVRVRARRHQIPRQDRMHLVLQPSALYHQMHPESHQPAPIGESGVRAGQLPVEAGDECCHLFAGDGLLG